LAILSRLRNLEEVVTQNIEKIATFAKVSEEYVRELKQSLNL